MSAAGNMVVNSSIFDYTPVQHENGEYFVIPKKDGGRTMLHKFHKIGDMPIEERIKELLSDRVEEK